MGGRNRLEVLGCLVAFPFRDITALATVAGGLVTLESLYLLSSFLVELMMDTSKSLSLHIGDGI